MQPIVIQQQPESTAPTIVREVHVGFEPTRLTGGGVDLYMVVDGKSYLLKNNLKYFDNKPAIGIPREAMVSGSFLEKGASEEDRQGIYAALEGDDVAVYTGFYEPGAEQDVQWIKLRSVQH